MNAEDYVSLISSQHRGVPRFTAWVRFLVSLFDPALHQTMTAAFSLDAAQGAQLDALGALCGVSRGVLGEGKPLDDALYRRLLRAKIVRNQFSGRQGELADIWQQVFGDDLQLAICDRQDMSMSVDLEGSADLGSALVLLILGGHIVPKPLGISIVYRLVSALPSIPLGSACVCTALGVTEIPAADDALLPLTASDK